MSADAEHVAQIVSLLRETEGACVLVTGSRGAGKSTLIEAVRAALLAAELPVLYHSAEEDLRACHVPNLLDTLVEEGRRVLQAKGLTFQVRPRQTRKNDAGLPCFDLAAGSLYLVLDGLDFALDHHDLDASFFPECMPAGMRLVVALSEGPLANALARRGYRVHPVTPLSRERRREVVRGCRAARDLSDRLLEPLLDWEAGQHPTHLLLAASHAAATGNVPAAADDVATVSRRLVDTLHLPGPLLPMLAVCRRGVPSGNFLEHITMVTAGPAIVHRGGFFLPATPEAAQALRARCTERELRQGHVDLAARLARVQASSLTAEAVRHLIEADEKEKLAELLTTFEAFQLLANRDVFGLARACRLAGIDVVKRRLGRMVDESSSRLDSVGRGALFNNAALLLANCQCREEAESYYRRSIEAAAQCVPEHPNLLVGKLNLARLLALSRPRYEEAEAILAEILGELADKPSDYPVTRWSVMDEQAQLLAEMRRPKEAIARYQDAVDAVRAERGRDHPAVGSQLLAMSRNIRWLAPARALDCAREGLALLMRTLGPDHLEVDYALRLTACAHEFLGQHDAAVPLYEQALVIADANISAEPMRKAYGLKGLADIAEARGDWQRGAELRERAYLHLRTHVGPENPETALAGHDAALGCELTGNRMHARELLEQVLPAHRAAQSALPPRDANVDVELARMRKETGDREGCDAIVAELAGVAPGALRRFSRVRLGLLRAHLALTDERPAEARELLEGVLRTCAPPADEQDGSFGLAHVMLGGLLYLAGEVDASERHHEAGIQHLMVWLGLSWRYALGPYELCRRNQVGSQTVIEARLAELATMSRVNREAYGLAHYVVPPCPERVAWHPTRPGLLALLNRQGPSYLLEFHEESGLLEALEAPFPPAAIPEDLASVSLRWSPSGEALCLATPDGSQIFGRARAGETWLPASAISPDGAWVAVLRAQTVRIVRAPTLELSPIGVRG